MKVDSIEIFRGKFLKTLDEIGLQVPPHTVIKGMENLRVFLKDKTDKWIKISKWRGDWETLHWRDWSQDEQMLGIRAKPDHLLITEDITYYVFDPIETEIEDS